uniref:IRS-type PTB domain-containing protein n=1 Tax=Musca domestica TaxID=7370 RepID=A0A1I8NG25_MUSDO
MGCISSSNSKLFSLKKENVYNVNVLRVQSEQSVILAGQGVLEITPNEIIFIAPNHEPVSWALQHLRRYGLTEDIFSFEAGRRCTTGPGIYTFRCWNANQLYSKFQWYINSMSLGVDRDRNGNSSHHYNFFDRLDSHQQQHHSNHYLEPTSILGSVIEQRTTINNSSSSVLNISESLLSSPLTSEIVHIPTTSYSNVTPRHNSDNIYLDQPVSVANENNTSSTGAKGIDHYEINVKKMIRTSSLDVPPDECAPALTPVAKEVQRIYSNIDLNATTSHNTNLANTPTNPSSEPAYANVDVSFNSKTNTPQQMLPQSSSPEKIHLTHGTAVNYIVLDLDQPRSPSQCSPKTTFGSGQSLNEEKTSVDISTSEEKLKEALSLPCNSSTMPKRTTMSDVRSNLSDTKIDSSGSYTRIDFLKTFALMKSSANYADLEPDHDQEESRITRHSKFIRKAYSISE